MPRGRLAPQVPPPGSTLICEKTMPRFMLNRRVSRPIGYAERGCVLVSYRLPLLQHCFVLCAESAAEGGTPRNDLMAFFLLEAGRLAQQSVGDSEAFMLIHSGGSIRKRASWHLHVFVVQRRWQKAWVYAVLAAKNAGLAGYSAVRGLLRSKSVSIPSIERPCHGRPDAAADVKRESAE